MSAKLEPQWMGPYYIHDIVGFNNYKLRSIEGRIVKGTIYTVILTITTLSPLLLISSQNASTKIRIFFQHARWQITLNNRKESLFYLYHIGQIIDAEYMTQKDSTLSKQYFTVSKRVFLIFEDNIEQLMRIQNTTIVLLARLKLNDLNELIHWSSFLKKGDI
ncbi:1386_t:CDS:2, partial [Funneliformis geosporum]